MRQALVHRKQVTCIYQLRHREVCPVIIGHTGGKERVFVFQFTGESDGPLPGWRCFHVADVSDVRLRDGPWHEGDSHKIRQQCIDDVDLDVNVRKVRSPQREVSALTRDTKPKSPRRLSTPKRRS